MEGITEKEVFLFIGIGIFIMSMMAMAFVAFHSRSQQKLFSQQLEAQEQLLHQTILAQEEERSRIAKDLHDDIGSKLNVIFLYVQQLKKKIANPEHSKVAIKELTDIINTTIDSTRRISHELLPPTLEEFGLTEALKELCDGFSKTEYLNIDLNIPDKTFYIRDKVTELNIFRILQELINNSVRHGKASNIAILFSDMAGEICIQYEDDGKGFDTDIATKSKGLGMNNLKSRLKMIGGEWTYESSLGNGLKAKVTLRKTNLAS